ncbi:TonB-dependent siderophore receptor [Thiomicrorhabdus sp. Kp2]|uniref:TonB-dependent receptor plug domain-containing protein n=1 Tax=Thiomicrorhabdus sp. Kp2 TaxID=1123518 RepID=UPI000425F38A|nr:TonB-dependent receptor [Thiomicrorhabdus sp. Kp2]
MSHSSLLFVLVCTTLLFSQSAFAKETTEIQKIEIDFNTNIEEHDYALTPLDTAASEIILSKQEISKVAGTQGDPLKALSTLPGVVNAYSSSGSGLSKGFYIRGSDSSENAIWIDDLPVGYAFHLGGLYSIVNPDLMTGFDTYLGGFGVEYGDKLGGAINITTKSPRTDKTQQSVQLGFYDSSYQIEGALSEKSSGYFAIRRSYFDLLMPSTGSLGNSNINYTQFPQFWDMQAKWRYRLTDGFVDVSVISSEDQLTLNVDNRGDILKDPAIAGLLGGQDSFSTYAIKWQQSLNQNWQQKIRLGLLSTKSNRFIGTQLDSDPNPGKPYNKDVTGQNWFLLPQWEYLGSADYLIKAGVDAYSYAYDVSGYWYQACQEGVADCNLTRLNKAVLNETINGTEASPYIEYQTDLSENLALTFGLRNSNVTIENNDFNAVSPRMSLEYHWSDDLILNANWGKFVQKPDFSQLTTALGNPNLALTEAEHRILGLKYKVSDLWSLQAEVYQKPMINLITTSLTDNYANTAKGEAKGFDLFLKRNYVNGASGWLSYGYSDSKRTDLPGGESRPFDGDQTHTLSAVWSQPMTGSWNKWHWGIKANASTGQPYTKVISRHTELLPDGVTSYWVPDYETVNSSRLPFYFRADFSMERDWKYRGIDLTTRFELININALFRQNVVGYLYNSDYSQVEEIYDLPFLPSFSIRGTF